MGVFGLLRRRLLVKRTVGYSTEEVVQPVTREQQIPNPKRS